MSSQGPRRTPRDSTGSRFYCAHGLSPEATFSSIEVAFDKSLRVVRDVWRKVPLSMMDARLQSFHRSIFGKLFGEGPIPSSEAALSVASLYTGILRVHPFVDDNHRASAVAFAAALASLDLPLIGFESDAELLAHDRAVGVAIVPERLDPEPFARLLEDRLRAAGP